MDTDLEIRSRIQDPSLTPLQPLYVDSWASLHVNMTNQKEQEAISIQLKIRSDPYK